MRVVIAEDQVLLRDGVARLLTDHGHHVLAQVGDGRALVAAVNDQQPDLVIADIRMPPTYTDEGAHAVRLIRDRFPAVAVVVLSQGISPALVADLAAGRAAGYGYLLKDRVLDTEEFLVQLSQVRAGGTVIDPTVADACLRHEGERLGRLTPREIEVLRLLATGLSNPGIAEALVVSRRTVDAHLRSIFAKLGIEADPAGNQRVLAALSWLGGALTR